MHHQDHLRVGAAQINASLGDIEANLERHLDIIHQARDVDLDLLVFLWDPFAPMPHDPDVKALLRLAALWNVPVASNAASADFLFHSKLISEEVEVAVPDANDWVSTRA